MQEEKLENKLDLENARLNIIFHISQEMYQKNKKPVKILDLATGGNEINPIIIKGLINRGIDYELILSDISPVNLTRGYKNLEQKLTPEELSKIKVILTDSNNLRKQHEKIPMYDPKNKLETLEKVLKNPAFYFLKTGYNGTIRKEKFKTESFDLIIGQIAYGSMHTYDKAISESIRVLKIGGHHIVIERQIERINSEAMRGTKIKHAENVIAKLDSKMTTIVLISNIHMYNANYYNNDEIVQNGDLVKDFLIAHRKHVL